MLTLRPETVDRVLIAFCAFVWLAFVGMSVAAIVALVDLGTGRHGEILDDPGSAQALYIVIVISALVIAGAIPLLVRARLAALATSGEETALEKDTSADEELGVPPQVPDAPPTEATTEKLRVFGSVADRAERRSPSDPAQQQPHRYSGGLPPKEIDRTYLRVTATIAAAMGIAMLFIAIGAYLMAVDSNAAALIALSFAAVITAVMPAIPWHFLGQLRTQIAAGG